MSDIRIGSYNLWYNKAYPEIPALAADNQLDILCTQECLPGGLAGRLGDMRLAGARTYANGTSLDRPAARTKLDAFWQNGGMAIYYDPARLELLGISSHQLSLPWSERKGGRFMQLAHFRTADGQELAVINIHLSALWSTNRTRRRQLEDAMSHIPPGMPAVLAGDFNYPIASRGLRSLMADHDLHECGTHDTSRTHISKLVKGKFDHIFISPHLQETDYAILPFSLSDHAPVMAALRLKR